MPVSTGVVARTAEPRRQAVAAAAARASGLRVLLVMPGAFGPAGGLELYDRLVARTFCERAARDGGLVRLLLLHDRPGDVDPRYLPGVTLPVGVYQGSKVRFALGAIRAALADAPDLVVFGHVGFAPIAAAIRVLRPRAGQWFLTYGIDVWKRLEALERWMLARAQRVVAISDYTRRELSRFNGIDAASVDVVPCALDPVWAEEQGGARAEAPPAAPVLLTVGRLAACERYKGVDQVIRALPRIAQRVPLVRYVVVGDGDDRSRLEALAREVGVADRVEFRGRVSAEALAHAYAECALFVMPSEREGFGIVFLEAALFGKPSLGGNHGGCPEVIEDGVTGYLVRHGDVDGLAEVAGRALAQPGLLADMGRAARERLFERFTYQHLAQRLAAQIPS